MSEWQPDERRRLLQNMERIATALEERLPPLSECNENEMLRARSDESFRRFLDEQRLRLEAERTAAGIILERDKLLHGVRVVFSARKFKGSDSVEFHEAMIKLQEIVGG